MSAQQESMFHEGHRALQDKFDGRRMADALEKHRRISEFREQDVEFIEGVEFFFVATSYAKSVDCSFRGAHPVLSGSQGRHIWNGRTMMATRCIAPLEML